jgi:prepilin peptidase CpaA
LGGSGQSRFCSICYQNFIYEHALQTVVLLAGIALLIAAAYGDIKSLRIPNLLAVAVALLGVFRLIVIGDLNAALHTISASVIILIITFLLFCRGFIGGGDAKLLSATVLLVGYQDLLSFLFLMSICGVLVSLAIFLIQRNLPLFFGPRLAVLVPFVPGAQPAVPYGVAIASAGSVTLLLQSSFVG